MFIAYKCKMCGGSLEISDNQTVAICEYCGTKQTLPKLNNDVLTNLYERANHYRRNNEFDKASAIYEKILNEDNNDAEAYWSLVLCKYGIEYVEDPLTHKRIPTVNRTQYTSIFDDDNYLQAIKLADDNQKVIYKEEANAINEIQKGILAISLKEEPFDVFICYKETDNNGRRTMDSVLANDLYHQLTQEGFKVFFARITLEDKLGQEYEPYIFAALNSSKVMVVLGTKPEYFNAVWVKNEWSRYLSLVKQSKGSKILIPAYRDMDPYDLPEEFSHLQAQDMSKLGFMQDLIRGIKKIINVDEPKNIVIKETVVNNTNTSIDPMIERLFIFLEGGEWKEADIYAEKVLDIDPKNALAYLGKLMAELKCRNKESLKNNLEPFDDKNSYQRAVRFADEDLKSFLISSVESIKERNEITRLTNIYNDALNKINFAVTEDSYKDIAKIFESISTFKDSEAKAKECLEKAEAVRKEVIYANARVKQRNSTIPYLEEAIKDYSSISGWRDVDEQIIACQKQIEDIKAEEERLRIERERKAEERRIAAEKRAKRNKKIALILTSITIVCIVFIFVLNAYIMPRIKYDKALSFIDLEDYESAYVLLKDLNYKDSEEILNNIRIEYAKKLLSKAEVGSIIYFGNYEQDNDLTNGKEDIEWLVLDKQDDKVLIISKYALDCQQYNTSDKNVTWETCTLRDWLNNTFINDAFSTLEQEIILTSSVSADENPNYDTNPGNATEDKIFLLSVVEADKCFASDEDRMCGATDYVIAQGVYTNTKYKVDEKPACPWWLRSPGFYQKHAAIVNSSGNIYEDGYSIYYSSTAVRPALWINLD